MTTITTMYTWVMEDPERPGVETIPVVDFESGDRIVLAYCNTSPDRCRTFCDVMAKRSVTVFGRPLRLLRFDESGVTEIGRVDPTTHEDGTKTAD